MRRVLRRAVLFPLSALLLFLAPPAAGDSAKTVLIVTAVDAASDDRVLTDSFQAELRNRWPGRVLFYVEHVGRAHFSPEAYERDVPQYLQSKHGGRVDLLVVVSRPALDFVFAFRESIFSGVPVLYTGAGATQADLQRAGMTGVLVKPEPAQTLALALRLHPGTTEALVVGGTDPVDRISEELARRALTPLQTSIRVSYTTGLPFPELLDRVAALPPRSIVLYRRVSRDPTGAVFLPADALHLIRSATSAPIYGCSTSYLGSGIVGGVLVDHQTVGKNLGLLAGRILAGEHADQIRPVVAANVTAFDARELKRLGISDSQLPAGASVRFRQPTFWQRYALHLSYGAALAALSVALGTVLAFQYRRRQRVERMLNERLRFQTLLSDLSTTFIMLPVTDIDVAVRGALRRLMDSIQADRVTIYGFPDAVEPRRLTVQFSEVWNGSNLEPAKEDWEFNGAPWLLSKLRAGQTIPFDDSNRDAFAGVPQSVLPAATRAAIAVPLSVGPSILGVMWCLTLRPPPLTRGEAIEQFQLIGGLFANALRRRHVERKLDETNRLNGAIFQSLSQNVAVIDRSGTIIAVNDAWLQFGRANGASSEATITTGANYLETARKGAQHGAPLAREAFEGISAVCEGRQDGYSLEYDCSSSTEQRWFLMTVAALRWKDGGAVITHRDITARRQAELAIGEVEERFQTIADALPVGIWMSGGDVRRTYFNRTWLDFTGRSIERELGDGWTDSLHPDDRQRYLEAYRSAIAARAPFSIEFRVRGKSGAYGWFIDSGVPRYAADGTFHGFIGGCVDITARKETEDVLRDLTGRLITAQEDDRRRVARELHDGLNQFVALMAIEIQQLEMAPPATHDELSCRLHDVWKRTAEISNEVHRLSHQLHPSRLEAFGLVAALDGYCAELEDQQLLSVKFSHENLPAVIPPDVALCLFRIVQEALRNVATHSGAREARVELSGSPDAVFLQISDTGRGFDEAAAIRKGGLGLVSMRERVRFVGGNLAITSRPGAGTRVDVRVPIGSARFVPIVAREVVS